MKVIETCCGFCQLSVIAYPQVAVAFLHSVNRVHDERRDALDELISSDVLVVIPSVLGLFRVLGRHLVLHCV